MTRNVAYVGTYTEGDSDSDGIYICEISSDSDQSIQKRESISVPDNPSFLTIHPNKNYLYAVHEVEQGGVTAFEIREGGRLRRLNRVESGAGGPCHCSVHPSGEFLLVAHYTGAAVSVLPIHDGRLEPPSDVVRHFGSSVHPDRQTQAHPHSVVPSPDGQYLYVADLGTDEIVNYRLNRQSGALEQESVIGVTPGAGPRHLSFHPSEHYVYAINELESSLTGSEWNAETGSLTEITTESTLPPGFDGSNIAAEVRVHPSGQWVYASNRGHHSVAIFEIDQETGGIRPIGYEPTRGEWPRNFALDTDGELLFAENQKSSQIVVFEIDDTSGALRATGEKISIPDPVCMQVLPQ
jgi:6-phosphogluconolactonase